MENIQRSIDAIWYLLCLILGFVAAIAILLAGRPAHAEETLGTVTILDGARSSAYPAIDGSRIPLPHNPDGSCQALQAVVGAPVPRGMHMKIRVHLDPATCEIVVTNHSAGHSRPLPAPTSTSHARASLCGAPTAVYHSLCRDRMYLTSRHYLRTSTYVIMHWSEQYEVGGFSFSGHAWADQRHFVVIKDSGDSTPYPPILQAYWAGQFVSPLTKRGAYAEPFSSARRGDDFRCSCLFELNPNTTIYDYECFGQHFLDSYGCPCRPDEVCS